MNMNEKLRVYRGFFFLLVWVHYGYHVYRPFKEKKTWNRAKVHCESIGAYLVEIESVEENEWILFNIVNQHLNSKKGKMMLTE